jgi:UDP-glucose 4-epimerase
VDAFVRAAERGGGLLCNIGTGVETSVTELYSAMAAAAGTDAEAVYGPARAGELARSALDPGRAGVHLGWEPWTDLPTGVGEVLRWFRSS